MSNRLFTQGNIEASHKIHKIADFTPCLSPYCGLQEGWKILPFVSLFTFGKNLPTLLESVKFKFTCCNYANFM